MAVDRRKMGMSEETEQDFLSGFEPDGVGFGGGDVYSAHDPDEIQKYLDRVDDFLPTAVGKEIDPFEGGGEEVNFDMCPDAGDEKFNFEFEPAEDPDSSELSGVRSETSSRTTFMSTFRTSTSQPYNSIHSDMRASGVHDLEFGLDVGEVAAPVKSSNVQSEDTGTFSDKRLRNIARDRTSIDEDFETERSGTGKRRAYEHKDHRRGGSFDGASLPTVLPSESQSLDNLTEQVKGINVQDPAAKTCKCTVCGKAFARKYTLVQHQRIHSNERTHKCPYEGCGKDFVQKANLSQHMRYHTGEKPYVCDEPHCNAAYYQLANLKSHLKAKHGRDVPRKCRIRGCGKGFVTAQELSEHHRVDHGRTPQSLPPKQGNSTTVGSVSAT